MGFRRNSILSDDIMLTWKKRKRNLSSGDLEKYAALVSKWISSEFCERVLLAAEARPPSCGDARWPIGPHAIPAAHAKGY